MILRIFAAVFLVYAFGFLAFAVTLPEPLGRQQTDAVIVLTGGPGRIARGVDVMDRGLARELLVSGVDPEVTTREFATEFKVPARLMQCCVTLGYVAVDTRGNADEAKQWLEEHKFRSVRLVTTDWHMARAASELREVLPPGMTLYRDAIPSDPSLFTLFLEYNKLLVATVVQSVKRQG